MLIAVCRITEVSSIDKRLDKRGELETRASKEITLASGQTRGREESFMSICYVPLASDEQRFDEKSSAARASS